MLKVRTNIENYYKSKYAYFLKDKLVETKMQIFLVYLLQYKKVLYACILILFYHNPIAQLTGLLVVQITSTFLRVRFRNNVLGYVYVFKVIEEFLMSLTLCMKVVELYYSRQLTDEMTEYDQKWKDSGFATMIFEMILVAVQNL